MGDWGGRAVKGPPVPLQRTTYKESKKIIRAQKGLDENSDDYSLDLNPSLYALRFSASLKVKLR